MQLLEIVDIISVANITKDSDNDLITQGSTVGQLGLGYTGQPTGDSIQILYPLGYWSPPLPSQKGKDGTQYIANGRTDEYFGWAGRDYLNQGKFKYTPPGAVQIGALGSPSGSNIFINVDGSIKLSTTSDNTANFINMTGSEIILGNGPTPSKVAYIDPLATALTAINTLQQFIQVAAGAGTVPDPSGASFAAFCTALLSALPDAISALTLYQSSTPQNGTQIVKAT